MLNSNKITTLLDYDIGISDASLIAIESLYNEETSDGVLREILNINILYMLYKKMNELGKETNIKLFKEYKGKGQLLWNYYQSIVKSADSSKVYGYVCDYIVPYLGYMLCFHTNLDNNDEIV